MYRYVSIKLSSLIRADVLFVKGSVILKGLPSKVLIKASSGAIETLNKIVIQDKKTNTTIASKKMDIESRKELQSSDQSHALTMSREEIMAKLINDKSIINVDSEVKEADKIT